MADQVSSLAQLFCIRTSITVVQHKAHFVHQVIHHHHCFVLNFLKEVQVTHFQYSVVRFMFVETDFFSV